MRVALLTTAAIAVLVAAHFSAADPRPGDGGASPAGGPARPGPRPSSAPAADGAAGTRPASAQSVLDFTVTDIEGNPVELSRYRGNVLVIVNVASRCGFTRQYRALQDVYERYKDRGLRILAFPANDFGNQEPGTNEQIKEFCKSNYSVTFDLFSKISVKGPGQHELYRFLTSREKNGDFGGEIGWNFTKFIIDRDGKVVERFPARVEPDSREMTEAIEAALTRKV